MPSKVVLIGKQPDAAIVEELKKLLKSKNLMGQEDNIKGRPATHIYANDHWVVKLHSAWQTSQLNAQRWVKQHIEKQEQLGLYPSEKYWFIIGQDDQFIPGNITVRLRPLHQVFEDSSLPAEQKLKLLEQVLGLYFKIYSEHQRRLDEGLSNFALDDKQQLFYVDDETYDTDELLALSQAIGVYLRSQPWLDTGSARQLGTALNNQILQHVGDPNVVFTFDRLLADLFIPDDKRDLLQTLQLSLQPEHKNSSHEFSVNRGIAVIADIHGNLPALEAVLADIAAHDIQQIWVLGDVVGYGPWPAECIERIRALPNCLVIKGNHDNAIAQGVIPPNFSRSARWSFEWTLPKISEEQKVWLAQLPPFYAKDDLLLVHGAPVDPTFFNAYVYDMTYESNLDYMQSKQIKLCLHGHSHLAGAYVEWAKNDIRTIERNNFLEFENYNSVLACPGSVGQPRDGSRLATYAILTNDNMQWRHIEYDFGALMSALKAAEFPDLLLRLYPEE